MLKQYDFVLSSRLHSHEGFLRICILGGLFVLLRQAWMPWEPIMYHAFQHERQLPWSKGSYSLRVCFNVYVRSRMTNQHEQPEQDVVDLFECCSNNKLHTCVVCIYEYTHISTYIFNTHIYIYVSYSAAPVKKRIAATTLQRRSSKPRLTSQGPAQSF